jgi:hypothetical protein
MYLTRMTYAHTESLVYEPENAIKLKCKQIPANAKKSYRIAFRYARQVKEQMQNRKTEHVMLAKKIKLNYRNQKE